MKEIFPSYYPEFRCIAGACRHSCCIGWEIDIDEETLSGYDDPAFPLYDRLQKNIDRAKIPHFCLTEGERCPFLNKDGLCDIIIYRGEESLCQICDDHPRFRNFFSDRTETGLGLCCEAAAELILFQSEPVFWTEEETAEETFPLTEEEKEFLSLRDEIYQLLQNRSVPIEKRFEKVLILCGSTLPEKTYSEWAMIYKNLERLDPAWDTMLDLIAGDSELLVCGNIQRWPVQLENLAVYFVFRHLAGSLDDDRLAARAAFCILSVLIIKKLWQKQGTADMETLTETVRLYSSEIEYSEDNLETLLSLLEQ